MCVCMYVYIYIYIYMKHDAVNWDTYRLKKKKLGHYLILKNVFQKYCGANISSTAKPIFNFRKSI